MLDKEAFNALRYSWGKPIDRLLEKVREQESVTPGVLILYRFSQDARNTRLTLLNAERLYHMQKIGDGKISVHGVRGPGALKGYVLMEPLVVLPEGQVLREDGSLIDPDHKPLQLTAADIVTGTIEPDAVFVNFVHHAQLSLEPVGS